MRPILFHVPAIPLSAWIVMLAAFFGVSAYWGAREIAEDAVSPDERRRRVRGTVLGNAALFLIGSYLVWQFRDVVSRPLPVRAYGFMLMIAFAAGMVFIQKAARGSALRSDMVVDLVLGLLLSAIIASRVLYVALNWGMYAAGSWRELLRIWEGGLSFHGGLLGGILWVAWFSRRSRLNLLWMMDVIAPALALGYAIARIGCFLNGCCYGIPTNLPWAMRFQDPPLSGHFTAPSHPVQIYASIANLAIFAALAAYLPRKRRDGQVFGFYLLLYSIYRFAAEMLRRGATGQMLALGLTQAQWASIATAAMGVLLMALWKKKGTAGAGETLQGSLLAGAAAPRGAESASRGGRSREKLEGSRSSAGKSKSRKRQ